MSQDGTAAPVALGERVVVLDGLRGFALLGVFIANMHSFSAWFMMDPAGQAALAGTQGRDLWMLAMGWLIDGKFYTIFSLLFGLGFALQLDRLDRRGDRGAARFRRRMAGLLAIGLCHLLLIWYGDILTLYALSGFVLLALRGMGDRRLLTLATALILLPVPGAFLVHLVGVPADFGLYGVSDRIATATGHSVRDIVGWIRAPDWKSFADWQASSFPFRIGMLLSTWRFPKVLAIMMIGLWAGRRLIDGTLLADIARLRRVRNWGFAIGLPASLLAAAMGGIEGEYGWRLAVAEIGYALGVVPLGLAYAASFVLAWPRCQRALGVFVPVGRMALTNYLSQSIVSVLIFHGIGLGLAGTLAPWSFTALAIAIFAAQIIGSRLWLARFGQGPMERLWRRMTYGRTPHGARP